MTVPVTQGEKDNGYYMQFYLPSKFTKENAPIPTNSDVKISTIDEGFFAVIEYSGRASDNNFFKHKEILNKKLLEDKVIIKGPPIRATYNGPFTLPMMRRNEAMFKVEWSKLIPFCHISNAFLRRKLVSLRNVVVQASANSLSPAM